MKNTKKRFSIKEKSHKKKNNKINNKNHEKSKKSPIKENIIKHNRISVKSACDVKIYKEYDGMKISQKNNINDNYFLQKDNLYISSACTLAKELNEKEYLNEDSYLIKENIFDKNYNIYGLFDGHGKDSHKISKNIAEYMRKFFSSKQKIYQVYLDTLIKKAHENNGKYSLVEIVQDIENGGLPLNLIKKIFTENDFYFIKKSVKYCEKKLKDKKYNLKFAGSSCLMLFLLDDRIICSNIGNSRCVLFKYASNGSWGYINLSNEHKPTNEEEKKRIREKGGEIHPIIDENGNYEDNIQRIWVKDKKYPGLEISRSIGDLVGKDIGVISDPTFICKKLDNRCKFIILGSNSFWEVMEFSEIIKIIKPYLNSGNPEKAAKILVEKAKQAWSNINERDDITVIVVFISEDLITKYETNTNVRISGGNY